jgi:hypothetical protein
MDLVPLACEVLRELIRTFAETLGDRRLGLWHPRGAAVRTDARPLRARDPLIEAARMTEQTQARMPGFGKKLFAFLDAAVQGRPAARLRLIKAACLLHDTTWRAHPDYRAEACFDNATRANLGGLDHPGRVFLGLALLHRYKNSRAGSRMEPLFRLLSEQDIQEAEVLGKAMRFGAMFAVGDPALAGSLAWSARKAVADPDAKPGWRGPVRRSGAGAVRGPGAGAEGDDQADAGGPGMTLRLDHLAVSALDAGRRRAAVERCLACGWRGAAAPAHGHPQPPAGPGRPVPRGDRGRPAPRGRPGRAGSTWTVSPARRG